VDSLNVLVMVVWLAVLYSRLQ